MDDLSLFLTLVEFNPTLKLALLFTSLLFTTSTTRKKYIPIDCLKPGSRKHKRNRKHKHKKILVCTEVK